MKESVAEVMTLLCGRAYQVVDGGNWLWKPQRVSREAVLQASRQAEAKSRKIVPGLQSRL